MADISDSDRLHQDVVGSLRHVLRAHRETRGWTQAELAERAGMTRNHYQLLEAGQSAQGGPANPRLSTLCSLAIALEIEVPRLIGE